MFAWPHEITVLRIATSGEDEYGNPIPGAETRRTWRGLFHAGITTATIGAAEEVQRFQTLSTVLLEPDADVRSADDLEWDGRRWRIEGEPLHITDLQGRFRQWELSVIGFAAEELVAS